MRPPVRAPSQMEPVAGALLMSRPWYRFFAEQLLDFLGLSTGAVRIPSLTTTERDALTAENGMVIYNSTDGEGQIYVGGTWYELGAYPKWDDLTVAAQDVKLHGVTDPDWVSLTDNLLVPGFDGAGVRDEEVFFAKQLPHGFDGATAISPHIHWCPDDAGAGVVRWGLEYSWAAIGTVFPSSTTIYVNADTPESAKQHTLSSFADIDVPASVGLSSMIVCRLFRNGSAAADTYDGQDALFLEFDFHIKKDSLGSTSESTK